MSFRDQRYIQRTRKDHKCWGCLEKIPTGSRALYVAGTVDGEFGAAYYCEKCDEFMTNHPDYFDGDGVSAGEIGEARREIGVG